MKFILLIFIASLLIARYCIHRIECFCLFQGNPCINSSTLPKGSKEIDIGDINTIYYKNEDSPYVVLYLHGNAGHIHNRYHLVKRLKKVGSFIMFDYHGYGKTGGSSDEHIVKDDAMEVYKHLRKSYDSNQIIIYGNSMGSSIAAWLAQELLSKGEYPKALIMQAGFCCFKHIVSDLFHPAITPFLTLSFNSEDYVKNIGNKIPVLIIHSKDDELIDFKHSKKLISQNPHAKFYEIKGDHNNPIYGDKFMDFLKSQLGL